MRLCFVVPNQPRSAPYRFNEFQKTLWSHPGGGTIAQWLYAPRGKVLYWTDGQEEDFNKTAAKLLREQDKYGTAILVIAIPDEVDEAALLASTGTDTSESVIDFSQTLTEGQRATVIEWLKKEFPAPPVMAAPTTPPPVIAAPAAEVSAPALPTAGTGQVPLPAKTVSAPDGTVAPKSKSKSTSKKAAKKSPQKKKPVVAAAPPPAPSTENKAPETPPSPPAPGGTL